jgi:hypothetical protein
MASFINIHQKHQVNHILDKQPILSNKDLMNIYQKQTMINQITNFQMLLKNMVVMGLHQKF